MVNQLPNFEEIYTTRKGSIGKYVPDECPTCKASGGRHIVDICCVCGWPPAMDGKCLCDWREAK